MDFEFFNVARIIVRRGGTTQLGELLAPMGKRVLVIHNAAQVAATAARHIESAGLACALYEQRGEPTIGSVQGAMRVARDHRADALVGIGGGSAIDCAKASAAILANGGEPLDYMEVVGLGKKITKPSLPWIAVPTTAGTGAEATRNAVVGCPDKQFKASIRSELMLPRIALLDATLAVGVPKQVTAASGADALCQLIESYTSTNANPISDGLALEGILRAAKSLQRAYDVPDDVDAREDMAFAALLSGITLTNAGLGAVHGFAAPMGGRYPVPHGVVCAALLPHVIRINVRALRQRKPDSPALSKYAMIAPAITGRAYSSEQQAVDDAVSLIAAMTQHMRIPTLGTFGVSREHVPAMVVMARKASSMRYNPIVLEDEELAEALTAAI